MLRFLIYYGDGSTYSGDPFLAPGTNVQIIVVEDPCERGFVLQMLSDMYYWNGMRWRGCDVAGMYDYLFEYLGPQKIVFGRTMPINVEFNALVARAMDEGLS